MGLPLEKDGWAREPSLIPEQLIPEHLSSTALNPLARDICGMN